MKILTVTVGKRMTVNLGDYNSVQVHCELTAELEEGETTEEVGAYLAEKVDAQLIKDLEAYNW